MTVAQKRFLIWYPKCIRRDGCVLLASVGYNQAVKWDTYIHSAFSWLYEDTAFASSMKTIFIL